MEGEELPSPSPWPDDEEDSNFGPGLVIDVVRTPKFWESNLLCSGCIIEFELEVGKGSGKETGGVAVYVKSMEKTDNGWWLEPKLLGGTTEAVYAGAKNIFGKEKKKIHVCWHGASSCPIQGVRAHHIDKLRVHLMGADPPEYVDKVKKREWLKLVGEFKALLGGDADIAGEAGEKPEKDGKADPVDKLKELKKKLAARGKGGDPPKDAPGKQDALGAKTKPRILPSPLVAIADERSPTRGERKERKRKDSPEKEKKRKRSPSPEKEKKAHGIRGALVAAATKQEEKVKKKKKKKKKEEGSSGSGGGKKSSKKSSRKGGDSSPGASSSAGEGKKKKKKKKKKKDKKEKSGSGGSEESDSTSSSMMPPLQKKAVRSPGSVLKMLLQKVGEALSEAAVAEDGGDSKLGNKMSSYVQIVAKPLLGSKVRDMRELETIARCIDLLRQGCLPEVGDALAGRFMAVESAGLSNSWTDAQHLEVIPVKTGGVAPPSVLLKAKRHSRQIEKASGKGSWQSSGSQAPWSNPWRQKGGDEKGKGKGKKGNKKGKDTKAAWKDQKDDATTAPKI